MWTYKREDEREKDIPYNQITRSFKWSRAVQAVRCVLPKQLYWASLKESEISSSWTKDKGIPSQAVLEVTHAPLPGCSQDKCRYLRFLSYTVSHPVFMSWM